MRRRAGSARRKTGSVSGKRPDHAGTLRASTPGSELDACLAAWEHWVNNNKAMPELLKFALGHYQFETIHPFVDGNGRVGRMLAVLTFIASSELRVPLLNISPFLEEHRDEYVDHLRNVSATGDFEPWVSFFAEAVRVQSEHALDKAERLVAARDSMMESLHKARVRGVALRIAEDLMGYPVVCDRRSRTLWRELPGGQFGNLAACSGRRLARGYGAHVRQALQRTGNRENHQRVTSSGTPELSRIKGEPTLRPSLESTRSRC